MADYFFDPSALVAPYRTKSAAPWVRSLIRNKSSHTLYIARMTAVEVSAIAPATSGRTLSPAQGGAMLGHFRRHLTQRYSIMELTPALFSDAMLVARKHGLRAYDAVQLAALFESTVSTRAGLGPVILVSADRELNTAAAAEGFGG